MGRKKHMLATSENRAHSIEKRLPNFLPRADAKSLRLEQTMEEESPFRLVDLSLLQLHSLLQSSVEFSSKGLTEISASRMAVSLGIQ